MIRFDVCGCKREVSVCRNNLYGEMVYDPDGFLCGGTSPLPFTDIEHLPVVHQAQREANLSCVSAERQLPDPLRSWFSAQIGEERKGVKNVMAAQFSVPPSPALFPALSGEPASKAPLSKTPKGSKTLLDGVFRDRHDREHAAIVYKLNSCAGSQAISLPVLFGDHYPPFRRNGYDRHTETPISNTFCRKAYQKGRKMQPGCTAGRRVWGQWATPQGSPHRHQVKAGFGCPFPPPGARFLTPPLPPPAAPPPLS